MSCYIDGCDEKVDAYGLCKKHYRRIKQYGTPEGGKKARGSLDERFWKKVDKRSDNECWLWTGARRNSGKYSQAKYGSFRVGKKTQAAHRVSYAYFNGRLDGDIVMHTCDNTLCVNPAHLKTGTVRDNVLDKLSKNRDHNQHRYEHKHGT
jgi:hypothetical protein